jgi:hypothetical protein
MSDQPAQEQEPESLPRGEATSFLTWRNAAVLLVVTALVGIAFVAGSSTTPVASLPATPTAASEPIVPSIPVTGQARQGRQAVFADHVRANTTTLLNISDRQLEEMVNEVCLSLQDDIPFEMIFGLVKKEFPRTDVQNDLRFVMTEGVEWYCPKEAPKSPTGR